eukprot:NODE_330_length_9451_cov_0.342173.p9 type:complete len:113 gc:universal NODE_330_length_9451_cov_0.342173:22-360(+)
MSQFSIDENGNFRVLDSSTYKESENLGVLGNDFLFKSKELLEYTQSNLSNLQAQVDNIEIKRKLAIKYRLLTKLEKQKRVSLEKQSKEESHRLSLELEQLQNYLLSISKGEE